MSHKIEIFEHIVSKLRCVKFLEADSEKFLLEITVPEIY